MLEVDKNTFEEEVLKADGYVFVDYFGDGCVPCQALMPFVHSLADKYGDKLKFTQLNTTKARRLAISQKILGLPVMAIYKNGEKVEELVKDQATEEIYLSRSWIRAKVLDETGGGEGQFCLTTFFKKEVTKKPIKGKKRSHRKGEMRDE